MGNAAPAPGLDIDVMAQLVGAVTGLAQIVQTLQQGPVPAPAPAPDPVHVQVPVAVPGVPENRATSAMREFYQLAPPTFHG